ITKFAPVDGKPWIECILYCNFWAKSCFLVTVKLMGNISSLQTLPMFPIEQSPTLYEYSHAEHLTIGTLYQLAMECTSFEAKIKEDLEPVADAIYSNNENLWHRVDASFVNVPGTLKTKNIVSQFNQKINSPLMSSMPHTPSQLHIIPALNKNIDLY
ncbi:hypothetical protein BY458DRAFT_432224, partial [Sporodiniella umbellata]